MILTKNQRTSLLNLWRRNNQSKSYRQFRQSVMYCGNYIMVAWCNMFVGIELDGHTHS